MADSGSISQCLGEDFSQREVSESISADKPRFGSSEELSALQGIARILTRQGRFDEALATLNRAKPDKLQAVWKENFLESIEGVKQARK